MKLDGSFHASKIKLNAVSSATIQGRAGYYARPLIAPEEVAQRELEDALFFRSDVHDFPLEVSAQSADGKSIAVKIHVNMRTFPLSDANGILADDLTVVIGLFDGKRSYIQAMKQVVQIRLTGEKCESAMESGVNVRESFDVKPGAYVVRAVAQDAEGQMIASGDSVVTVR